MPGISQLRSILVLVGCVLLSSCLHPEIGSTDPQSASTGDDGDVHEAALLEQRFPSAKTCGKCHPRQYREWSASPHAYAQLSPVFNAMHGTLLQLTNGTNGDFCTAARPTPCAGYNAGCVSGPPVSGPQLSLAVRRRRGS